MAEKKKVYLKTYGCQMNVYDSDRIIEQLAQKGFEATPREFDADLIVLNTCHIREKAAEKVYSELGKYSNLKNKKPKLKIGVAGCVAQAEGNEIIKRQPLVDFVVGPQTYHTIPTLLEKLTNGQKVVDIEFSTQEKFENLKSTEGKEYKPSQFLTVQEGCDKFCSFCVVPYTRGVEVSRPLSEILSEAKTLTEYGAIEITLLGQNVNAYNGLDDSKKRRDLSYLIHKLSEIDGLKRIRFVTSHPVDMTDSLIQTFRSNEKLMPYLHLPIQSGSDEILKKMNRRHNVSDYLNIIEKVREARPDIAISGDFIVGFPGESDCDFERTLEVCHNVGYASAFSFKYSPRPGTTAFEKKEVPEHMKKERLTVLQDVIRQHQYSFQKNLVGKILSVLVEKKGRFEGQVIGKSPYLQPVFFSGPSALIGKIVDINITGSESNSLSGNLCE
ncbi:MAG: tRNA (N6-isopentenyl adenosine(37)-C2)-methylthiotransferase MiaB [Paracoccaceae bacterium]